MVALLKALILNTESRSGSPSVHCHRGMPIGPALAELFRFYAYALCIRNSAAFFRHSHFYEAVCYSVIMFPAGLGGDSQEYKKNGEQKFQHGLPAFPNGSTPNQDNLPVVVTADNHCISTSVDPIVRLLCMRVDGGCRVDMPRGVHGASLTGIIPKRPLGQRVGHKCLNRSCRCVNRLVNRLVIRRGRCCNVVGGRLLRVGLQQLGHTLKNRQGLKQLKHSKYSDICCQSIMTKLSIKVQEDVKICH